MELAQVQPNLFSYSSLARSAGLWQQGVQVLHAVDARRLEVTCHMLNPEIPEILRGFKWGCAYHTWNCK